MRIGRQRSGCNGRRVQPATPINPANSHAQPTPSDGGLSLPAIPLSAPSILLRRSGSNLEVGV